MGAGGARALDPACITMQEQRIAAEINQGLISAIRCECNLELLPSIYLKCRGVRRNMTFRLCAPLPTINLLEVNL